MFKRMGFCLALLAGPVWAGSPAVAPGNFAWRAKTSAPVVALTFDDGPGPYTEKVLDVLKAHKAKATFFMLGEMASARPHLAARIVQEGHEPASHLYTHTNFAKVRPEEGAPRLAESMRRANEVLEKTTGQKVRFCRMPHGIDRPWIRQVAREQGVMLVNWTFGFDWLALSKEDMAKAYVEKIQPGAIILMHDGGQRQKSVDVLVELIQALEQKGFQMVTVGELLERYDAVSAGQTLGKDSLARRVQEGRKP
jgi:peptidoglycan-N-acetylglucosamine deacetylase